MYDDPVYNDRHAWNSAENGAYMRWETSRHLPHIDYDRRPTDEKREYWTWRHQNPG